MFLECVAVELQLIHFCLYVLGGERACTTSSHFDQSTINDATTTKYVNHVASEDDVTVQSCMYGEYNEELQQGNTEPFDANGGPEPSVMTPDELDEAMESRLAKELITEVYKVDGKRTLTVLDSSTYRCETGCKNTGRYNPNLKGSSVYDLPPKGQGIDGHVVQLAHFNMVQKNLKKTTATNARLKEQYATNVSPYHRQANA